MRTGGSTASVSRPRPVGGRMRYAGIDQGVDWTGPGPVYAVGAGEITRLEPPGSTGWPGEGALLVYKIPGLRKFVYVAEDFAARSGLKVGSKVKAGELLGQATGSGKAPGIEMGWAQPSGAPVAPLPPPRPASQWTAEGADFARFVGADSSSRPRGGASSGVYDYQALADLWTKSGGDGSLADTMAAIALAESSGDPEATNINLDGSIDRGLWQVNSINYDSDTLLEPSTNVGWAIKIEKQQGLRAWTTYKTGAYKTYLKGGDGGASVVRTRPAGGDGGGGGGALSWLGAVAGGPFTVAEKEFESLFGGVNSLTDVFKGLVWLMNPRSWLRMVEFVTGALMMLFGVIGLGVMFLQRSETVGKAANVAQALPGPVGGAGRAVTSVRAVGRGRGAATRPRPRARASLSEDEQLNQEQLARERYERQNRNAARRRQRIDTARAVRENRASERTRGARIRAGREQISDDDIPF